MTRKRGRPKVEVDVDEARRLHVGGLTITEIARRLRCSRRTIRRRLMSAATADEKVPAARAKAGHNSRGVLLEKTDPDNADAARPGSGAIAWFWCYAVG